MSVIEPIHASTLAPEQLERDLRKLDGRDIQLWCIGALLFLVVAGGFLALLMPQVVWDLEVRLTKQEHVTPYFFGLLALLILLNLYMFDQRRNLQKARRELIHQLQLSERIARIDPLTGVFNRRYMEECISKEIARAERGGDQLSVAVIDVDNFKSFNTQFGHVVGDRVLTDVAGLLKRNFRAADIISRYGGDEFVTIMPDTDLPAATAALERLLRMLGSWNQENRSCGYSLSLSCGLAKFTPGVSSKELLHTADLEMYAAKQSQKLGHATTASNISNSVPSLPEAPNSQAMSGEQVTIHPD